MCHMCVEIKNNQKSHNPTDVFATVFSQIDRNKKNKIKNLGFTKTLTMPTSKRVTVRNDNQQLHQSLGWKQKSKYNYNLRHLGSIFFPIFNEVFSSTAQPFVIIKAIILFEIES